MSKIERFDYLQSVKDSVLDFIDEEEINIEDYTGDRNALIAHIMEYKNEDCLTGMGSRSYNMNISVSEECICHNFGLLADMIDEFCASKEETIELMHNPDNVDAHIRLYVLPQAIELAISELEKEKGINLDTLENDSFSFER